MQLLIIRHAIAGDRDQFATGGGHDDERPLTVPGKRRMRRNARGLHRQAPRIAVLASSPLVRAQQTADIVAAEYRLPEFKTLDALRPKRQPRDLIGWLARQPADATVAVVGHEPFLGMLVGWCIAGVAGPAVSFKKGGAALVQFDAIPDAGNGRLLWLLTPAQLRAVAD